jgi:glycosyltransferase involved in cell wall biosynthesis
VTTRPVKNILLITGDPLGPHMAGPGIRCLSLAKSLISHGFDVQVITTGSKESTEGVVATHVARRDRSNFKKFHEWADAVIIQALGFDDFPELRKSTKILVVDAYAPVVLESLARFRTIRGVAGRRILKQAGRIQREQVLRSDILICANENQRMFYLGSLASTEGLTFEQYVVDESLRNRIVTVPFGLSRVPPVHRNQVLKGVVPGISKQDKVVLWSGGIYEWFDVETLINAFALISEQAPEIKLFFQGGKHPNSDIPEMPIVGRSKILAAELGVLNENVFFNDKWVSLEDRESYLTEADLGVTTHFDSLETTFSFRTRMLDYIWAGLPVITTEGDYFAKEIWRLSLGSVTSFSDPEDLARSIIELLNDRSLYGLAIKELEALRPSFFWDEVVMPLVQSLNEFVPNKSRSSMPRRLILSMKASPSVLSTIAFVFSMCIEVFRNEGIRALASKLWRKIEQ